MSHVTIIYISNIIYWTFAGLHRTLGPILSSHQTSLRRPFRILQIHIMSL